MPKKNGFSLFDLPPRIKKDLFIQAEKVEKWNLMQWKHYQSRKIAGY